MDSSMIARLKVFEAENTRLNKVVAEERIKADMLKETIEKNGSAISPQTDGAKSSLALSNQYPPSVRERPEPISAQMFHWAEQRKITLLHV